MTAAPWMFNGRQSPLVKNLVLVQNFISGTAHTDEISF